MQLLEISAVIFTLGYMLFAIRQKPMAWIMGIIASIISMVLFYGSNWGSTILNFVYVVQGVLGFLEWQFFNKNRPAGYYISKPRHSAYIFIAILTAAAINALFQGYIITTTARIDMYLAMGSILATFIEIRKDTSCWYYWILLNFAYAALYYYQGLYFYTIQMVVLALFSFKSLNEWVRHPDANVQTSGQ